MRLHGPPSAPRGLVAQRVAFQPDVEPARTEYFVRGTAMAVVSADSRDAARTATASIRYPADDTIIALDPDIPAGHQRVRVSGAGVTPTMR